MKLRSLFLGLLVTGSLCLPPMLSRSSAQSTDTKADVSTKPDTNANNSEGDATAATNQEPTVITLTNVVNIAEVEELRTKLDALQRANDLALGRWSALLDQNSALSNVLTDLRQTLVTQRQREVEVTEQARAFNIRVMIGAAVAMFLVFLASYWFQLRCLNRVMEISQVPRELPAPFSPALLEAANARESQLLEAVKLLENRIRQLEAPVPGPQATPIPPPANYTNGVSSESGRAGSSEPQIIDATPLETQSTVTKVSVLLAKGEVLLETERLQEAVSSFNEAVALEPNNAEAHLKKGIALERLNRLELALSSYNEALRLNPRRSFAYVHKARVLAALHRYDEALSVYDLALGKSPQKATTTTGSSSSTELHHRSSAG